MTTAERYAEVPRHLQALIQGETDEIAVFDIGSDIPTAFDREAATQLEAICEGLTPLFPTPADV